MTNCANSLKLAFICLFTQAVPARAETILSCIFPTLPSLVMRFPDGPDAAKTMEIGGRAPVALTEGQGVGRVISASLGDYKFRFSPENSMLDVEESGLLVASETGQCVTIGGPINDSPLVISPPPKAGGVEIDHQDEGVSVQEDLTETGNWVVTEDKSALDDSTTVVLSLNSRESINGQFGPAGPAMLVLRCFENTTVLYLWLNNLFLSDIQGFGIVSYRIDDGKASELRMKQSTDNKALGLWSGSVSIPIIKKLIEGRSIVMRATPFNESPIEFSFDLLGLGTAITPLREACNW